LNTAHPPAFVDHTSPRSPIWNLIPLAGGLFDPLLGVFGHLTGLFWSRRLAASADSPKRRKRGLALVLGGIEGPSRFNRTMATAVLFGRFRGAVARFPWNAGVPAVQPFINLMRRRHHEKWSDRLVKVICEQKRNYPHAPVSLLAQSGGCWIVTRALEKLPDEVRAHSAILLAPSISSDHDPSRAANKCTHGLYSIGGPGDFMFLGLGTTIFGTSDRTFAPSAGLLGWRHRPKGFTELRWRPEWTRLGYLGNHTSSGALRFIQHVITPLFQDSRQS
jgi:hypothetical protein